MLAEVRCDEIWEGDDAPAGARLGRPEGVTAAARVVDLPGNADGAGVQVDVLGSERGEFSPAEASEGGEQDQHAVAGVDGVGNGVDLRDGEHGALGRVLVASALDSAWVALDQPVIYGGVHDGAKQPVGLGSSDRADAVVEQLRAPAPDSGQVEPAIVMAGKYGAICERSR
jgi:hypothetical protein